MQETPETRAKLANAINQLRSQGREAEVNSVVSAYKSKYTNQPVVQSEEQPGILKSIKDSVIGTVTRPAVRLGETVGVLGVKAFGTDEQYKKALDVAQKNKTVPTLNVKTSGIKQGIPAIKQIGGETLETASNIYGGAGIPSIVKGIASKPVRAIATGALTGGITGTVGGAGFAMQEDKNTKEVLTNALQSGALGVVLGGAIPAVGSVLTKGVQKTIPMLTKEGRVNRVIKSRDKVLTNIEESYASVKKTVDKQKARGIDVKKIVADKDILVNAVDENGNINTKQAVENIMPAIEEREGVIGKILEQEGRTININKLKNEMVKGIKNTRSIFGKNTALASIEDDLADLANLADANGNIKVSDIYSAKVDKYSKINYDNPAVAQFEKAKAKVFKQIVENETKGIDVGAVNKELQTLYAVQNYLEKLQGKKVEGGRLGKHFARVTGAIVGGHFGPIGALLGSELSGGIKGMTMKAGLSGRTGNIPYKAGAEMQNALDRVNNPKVLQLPAYSNIDGNLNANQIKTTIPNINDMPVSIQPIKNKSIPLKTNQSEKTIYKSSNFDKTSAEYEKKYGTTNRDIIKKALEEDKKSIPKKNTQAGFISTGGKKSNTLYHGTDTEFTDFDVSKMKSANYGKGVYLTDNETLAKYYSTIKTQASDFQKMRGTPEIPERRVGFVKNVEVPKGLKIKTIEADPTQAMIERAKTEGFDGVKFKDTIDKQDWNSELLGDPTKQSGNTTVIFDPKKLNKKK